MTTAEVIEILATREADKMKYIYENMLLGLCSEVFRKAGVKEVNPIPEEYFDAVIDGVCESFWGCEPEFDTEDEYERYQALIERFKTIRWIVNPKRCPYRDKTTPFLGYERDEPSNNDKPLWRK